MNSTILGASVNTPAAPLYLTRRPGIRLAADWQPPAAIWKRPAGKNQPHTRLENRFWSDGIARSLKPIASAVYCYLRSLADANAQCWPSPKTIARAVGTSESSAKRALKTLERQGLVHVGECFVEGSEEHASNLYTLLPLANWRDPQKAGPTSGPPDPTEAAEVGPQRPGNKNQSFTEQEPNSKPRPSCSRAQKPPGAVVAPADSHDTQKRAECEQSSALIPEKKAEMVNLRHFASQPAEHAQLVQAVLAAGVKPESAARALVAQHAPEEIRLQLDCLEERALSNPAGGLVKALREGWAPPRSYTQRIEAQRAEEARREEAQREREKKRTEAQRRAEKAQQGAQEEARLEEAWNALSEPARAEIEAQARGRLGVLGEAGRAPAALRAMCRTLLRQRLEAAKSPASS